MTDASDRRLLAALPDPEEYRALRVAAGLSSKSAEQAAAALAGTWAFLGVRDAEGALVAMGRVIGDGGWYFLVADMAVHPAHQRRGHGAAILDGLLAEIRRRAPEGARVTLTADPPGRRLYASRGFEDVAPARTGMHRRL